MKVSVVCMDLSNACLGRAHVLARLLSGCYDVEIVGRQRGNAIWAPLRNDAGVPIRVLRRSDGPRGIVNAIDGDLIYAVKPKGASLGLSFIAKALRRRPLIADVDDWEMALFFDKGNHRWVIRNAIELWEPDNLYGTWAMERMVRFADAVTVSTTFLQSKFGGTIIPHTRDAAMFDPMAGNDSTLRTDLGLDGRTVILFLGSPRPSKGIDDVIAALDYLSDPSIAFLIVGADRPTPHRPYATVLGPQPFSDLPRFLAVADMVVLAQRQGRISAAQLPAKVFDAMAMQRPVVATNVGDLPAILDGCGLIVEPGNVIALAEAIRELASNPDEAARLGRRGRERFLAEFTDQAVRPRIEALVDQVLAGSQP
jgi:glycosyltransferase involved in cell wall biosynthesis